MAEQQQVELDTDGFQEQEVQVAESKSQEDTEPKVESVDLGYTDPIKADEKAEVEINKIAEINNNFNLCKLKNIKMKRY